MRMHLYPQMRIFRIWGYSANEDFTQIRTFRIYTSAIVSVSRINNVKLRLESNWAGLANGGFRLLARGNDNDQWIKNISRGNLHQPAKQINGVREVPDPPTRMGSMAQAICSVGDTGMVILTSRGAMLLFPSATVTRPSRNATCDVRRSLY